MVSPYVLPLDQKLGGHWLYRMPWKEPCVVAATGNVDISNLNNGDTVDGVVVATGQRVLLPLQSSGLQNGIYLVGATAGTTVRTGDFGIGDDVLGAYVPISRGTYTGMLWHVTNTTAPTVDTDAIDFELATFGAGASTPFDHGAMGATETVDLADGDWHRGTLSADCAITVQGFTVDEGVVLLFEVTQDSTPRTITWDADVDFGGGDDQPATGSGVVTVFMLFSSAGDSTIYGAKVGGSGSVGALDDLSDVVITSPAEDDQLQYVGGTWVNNARRWEAVTDGEDVFVWDGDDLVHEWETY